MYKMYIPLYIKGEGKESNMKKFTLEICADSFESAQKPPGREERTGLNYVRI